MVYIDKSGAVLSEDPMKKVREAKNKKSGRYSKLRKSLKKSAKSKVKRYKTSSFKRGTGAQYRTGATRLIGSFMPISVGGSSKSVTSRGTRRVGRPKGPSGKYYIPGRGPVGVYEWRKWASRQRALQRLRMPEEYDEYEEGYEMEPQYEQQVQYQPPQQIQRPTGNILQAPNVFRGELRNVGTNTPYRGYDNVEKPISNPRGDYFTDVDPFTGKQILRRRPRERWAEGG